MLQVQLLVRSHEDLCSKLTVAGAPLFCWSLLDFSYKLELLGLENNSTAAGILSSAGTFSCLCSCAKERCPRGDSCPAGWGCGSVHIESRVYCSCGSECLCEEGAAAHFLWISKVFPVLGDEKVNFNPLR